MLAFTPLLFWPLSPRCSFNPKKLLTTKTQNSARTLPSATACLHHPAATTPASVPPKTQPPSKTQTRPTPVAVHHLPRQAVRPPPRQPLRPPLHHLPRRAKQVRRWWGSGVCCSQRR